MLAAIKLRSTSQKAEHTELNSFYYSFLLHNMFLKYILAGYQELVAKVIHMWLYTVLNLYYINCHFSRLC